MQLKAMLNYKVLKLSSIKMNSSNLQEDLSNILMFVMLVETVMEQVNQSMTE